MKHIEIKMNGKSSGRKSRFLATPQLLRRIVAVFVMIMMCCSAWSQATFPVVGKPYALRANTTAELYLDPQTTTSSGNFTIYTWSDKCILTFAQSTNTTNRNNGYYSIKNNNGYYAAVSSSSNWNTESTQTYNSSTADWKFTLNDGKYRLTSIKNSGAYLGVDNKSAGSPTYYDKNWNKSMSWTVYSVYTISISGNPSAATATIGGQSYSNGSYYRTTSSTVNASSVAPSNISGYDASVGVDDNLGTITITYQRSTTPTTLSFTSNALTMTATALSLPGVSLTAGGNPISGTVTYSSSNTGCVNVSNTGALTINGAGTATITASYAGNTTYAASSATMTITVVNTDALNETSYSDMTITPASTTLDLGGTSTYTASASISQVTRTRQQFVTITANSHSYYKLGETYQANEPTITETPGEALTFTQIAWTFSGGNGNYYSPSQYTTTETNTQVLTRTTQKTATNQTFTITATGRYGGWDGPEKTATATVTIPLTLVNLTNLYAGEAINLGIGSSESINGHFTYQPNDDAAGASYLKFQYTSADESVATVDAEGNVSAVGAGTTTITIQSIKIDGTVNTGVSCDVSINVSVAAPTISIDASGNVTITSPVAGLQIRYTTDGTNPTASTGTVYGGTFTATNEQTVKAVAVSNNIASPVASKQYITSGISGSKVILNDYEDHNWAYYKGREGVKVGTADNAPDYNDKYKYTLYMPDPRNVKITYRGYNTANSTIMLGNNTVNISTLNPSTAPHVSPVDGEGQNTFVYYKTLEKFVIGYFTDNTDWNGIPDDPDNTAEQYPYTVISNPFSVRPSTTANSKKTYYGFGGWKIIDGGEYIQGHNDGDILNLDELIHFTNLNNNYTPNCTSAEIVLEATWAEATVWRGHDAHSFTEKTYETNFIVADDNIGSIEQGTPCTIIGMNPDGTSDNSASRTITGLKVTTTASSTTNPYDRSNCVKVEWILHGNGTFNANGRNMTLGRGIKSSSNNGNGAQGSVYGNNGTNQNIVNTVKVESGFYSKITNLSNTGISGTYAINCYTILGCDYDRAQTNYYLPKDEATNSSASSLYPYNTKLRSNAIKGADGSTPQLNRKAGELYIRSLFKSGIFAISDAEYYFHSYKHFGQRYIEMEGGYLCGNIKGGSESTTYNQEGHRAMSIRMRNGRIDEQIGCGSTSDRCSGARVVAITGGRIGGWIAPGSNCMNTNGDGLTDAESFVYFGGTAEINSRQFNTSGDDIFGHSTGGVIYGAGLGMTSTGTSGRMRDGSNIIFADEAYCERGIYGGGAMGETQQTANIFILGGRVGTGEGTILDESLGSTTATRSVTVQAGVYGGACKVGGQNSFIYMDGGTIESGIYGGSNINGTMTGNVTMQINGGQVGTDATHTANVHGGGYGQGTVVSGNVAVTIGKTVGEKGPDVFGNVFGGAALGTVTGSSTVTVNAGTCTGAIYGGGLGEQGNNTRGVVSGDITVTVNGTDPKPAGRDYAIEAVFGGGSYAPAACVPVVEVHNCDNSIGEVYGGGNAATVQGSNVTVYGCNKIGNVFGGCNQADVTESGTSVAIFGGVIDNVFGGNNHSGVITGPIEVSIDYQAEGDPCQMEIGNVYGGGNEAYYTDSDLEDEYDYPIVRIYDGSILHDVFGGGLGETATVTGNPQVEMTGGQVGGTLYGGGSAAPVTGTPHVKMNVSIHKGSGEAKSENWWDVKGYVFGGGLGESAKVTGNTKVEVLGTSRVGKNVYGGGNGGAVTGNTDVTIGQ